jgi:hypothetical protein
MLRHKARSAFVVAGAVGISVLFLSMTMLGATPLTPALTHISSVRGPAAELSSDVIRPASQPNGNLSLSVPQPSTAVVPGMFIQVQLEITAQPAGGQALPADLTIWVPQTIALFRTSNGTIQVIDPAIALNFTPGTSSDPSALVNASSVVKAPGTFNITTPALLTSQLLSFMTNAPYGSLSLSATWRWALAYPDGSTSAGGWSPTSIVLPAEYAQLVSYGPTTIPVHGNFRVCMVVSGTSREFSLHLETISPVDDFIQVEQNVTGTSGAPTCWEAQVASWVTPQPILAHVWAYDQKTFLLYLIKIAVVNATQPLDVLSPILSWSGVATVGALLIAVALVGWSVRSRRRSGPNGGSPG